MVIMFHHSPIAGVYFTFSQSNAAGKLIVLILVVASIFVWSIMITKIRQLAAARKRSSRFLLDYRKETHPAALFLKRQKYSPSPLYEIYDKTCLALGGALESGGANPDDLFMGAVGKDATMLGKIQVSSIRNVAERTMADSALLLEDSMGLLATATTTAPFLGLLGTVWGVMEAFGGMASAGGSTLSAVAPGISGALLTTVVGLIVALPSAIGYNMLSDRIRKLTVEMDNFTQELISDVETNYLRS